MLLALSLSTARGRLARALPGGSWQAAGLLAIYMVTFAWGASVGLKTGTGALLLFGTVQITMIGIAFRSGNARTWNGSA